MSEQPSRGTGGHLRDLGAAALAAQVMLIAGQIAAQHPSERARELMNRGRPAEAAAIYRDLSRADPGNPDLLLNLSIAQYKAGRFGEAVQSAAAALKLNPDLMPARLFLGASYLELERYTDAIDALDRVVAVSPRERNARLMLGEALLRSGRAEAAVEQLKPASDMLPASPRVWYALGRSYELLNRHESATEAWNRLMALPPSVESHIHSAETREAVQNWTDAAAEWSEALKLAPDNRNVRIKLAWSLFRRRDYHQVMSVLKPALSGQNQPDVSFLFGASLLNLQEPEKAIPLLREALAANAGLLPARAAMGQALLQTGKVHEAIPLLEQSLGADPDGSVHFQLFRAYQLTGQPEKAQQALAGYRKLRASRGDAP